MLTRTRTEEKSHDREDIPLPLSDEAKHEIDKKWFYLYPWISAGEVKTSVERDYLQILSKVWLGVGIVAIIMGFLGGWLSLLGFFTFFSILWVFYTFVFLYLFFVALRRSFMLMNTANVVLTDRAISFGWDIIPYEKIESYKRTIQKWENEFQEPLFLPSHLKDVKNSLMKETVDTIGKWWKMLFNTLGRSQNRYSGQAFMVLTVFGLVYTWVMALVYFWGLFFVWIFSLLMMFIWRFVMRLSWHTVRRINDGFENIDALAHALKESNERLVENLRKARENEWKDALLTNINSGIESINASAKQSLDASKKLRNTLESSQYKSVFNFDTYTGWIRTQIILPLRDIRDLLTQNHLLLSTTIDALEKEMQRLHDAPRENALIPKASSLAALEAQKLRLERQREIFEKHGAQIDEYLRRLDV